MKSSRSEGTARKERSGWGTVAKTKVDKQFKPWVSIYGNIGKQFVSGNEKQLFFADFLNHIEKKGWDISYVQSIDSILKSFENIEKKRK